MTYHTRPSRGAPPAPHAMPGMHGRLVAVGLGDVPRGFYETSDDCGQTNPAFLRGTLYDKAAYYAMSWAEQKKLETPPRWVLYAGPFAMRQEAIAFDSTVWHWANKNGYVWLSMGTPCIVPSHRIPWPPDKSWQWSWVYEQAHPRRVARQWSAQSGQYGYVWVV